MTSKLNGICPLCRESFPLPELHAHVAAEQEAIRRYTIKMIRVRHPEWIEDDGACRRCWGLYAALGRMVNIFRPIMPAKKTEA